MIIEMVETTKSIAHFIVIVLVADERLRWGNDKWGKDEWGKDEWGKDKWGHDKWGKDEWGNDEWDHDELLCVRWEI